MTTASPFPGMDPFLEDPTEWDGVHIRLISSISDQLTRRVQLNFSVKIEAHTYLITSEESRAQQIVSDGYLIETPSRATWAGAAVGIMTPTMVEPIYSTEITERWIEIRDKRDRSIVTTIEVLSPFNKAKNTAGRTAFLQKRNKVMLSRTHWVEIDLLRAGERPIEVADKSDYYALLKRSGILGAYEVWYFDLRDPLPTIAIPLRPPFDDVPLDLQSVFTDVYQRGRYAADIDYGGDVPAPTVRPPVALWLKKQIAAWRDQESVASI
jgi:Protein of unknown function (DUF4058)